jgi:hypothetical protein
MKKCYATIHVWLHDMDHNIDLNYRRKIRPKTRRFCKDRVHWLHAVAEMLLSRDYWIRPSMSETWPVQNENTSIQYPVWFSNTEVSVSVSNLKNTEEVSVSVCQKNWSISIQYQYPLCKKKHEKTSTPSRFEKLRWN